MNTKELDHMPKALRLLANEIQAPDYIPAMCLRDAAAMIESLRLRAETAEAELEKALDEVNSYEEREALCCPEDIGFDEFISTLQESLRRKQADVDAACRREDDQIRLRQLDNEQLAASKAEVERLKSEIDWAWNSVIRITSDKGGQHE